jgi:hypothetical protein
VWRGGQHDHYTRGDPARDATGGLHQRGQPSLRRGEGGPGQGTRLCGSGGHPRGSRILGQSRVSVRSGSGPSGDRDHGRLLRGGVWLRRLEQRGLRPRDSGAGPRLGEFGNLLTRSERPGDGGDLQPRLGGAEAEVAPPDGEVRENRLLRPYRAGGWKRPRLPFYDRRRGGRRLRP